MGYIKCNLKKTIYFNEINNYTVAVVKIKDTDIKELVDKQHVHIVGTLPELNYRTTYKFNGEYTKHNKYGDQLTVNTYEVEIPTKEEELVGFLSSDMFPIGEVTAKKIVDKFKDKTLDIILNDKDKLLEIPRLSEEKINKIHDILTNYQGSSKIVMEMTSLGFNNKEAMNILKKYGTSSLDKIKDNIYNLIDDMEFSFNIIDDIANNMGIIKDDDRRIEALIIYVMKELCFENGDTYLYIDDIHNKILNYIKDLDKDKLEEILILLNKKGKIVIDNDKYYLKSYYDAEEYITYRLCYLNDMKKNKIKNLEDSISRLEKSNHITYDSVQKDAIMKALNNNLTIITGGPGTGKTTIIRAIVYLLKHELKAKVDDIALLAPTGRAAKKMMETTNIPAFTIHKYLGWDKERNTFIVDEYNPNPEKYIIIDEVSMIDTVLMSSLLKGTRRDVKLILVGDYYQLPSVAPGQVLKDLIDSDMIDVIKLKALYRQGEESYIPILATEIKDKDISESFLMKKDDYNFLNCSNEEVMLYIEQIVLKAIEKGYTDKDIQILAPMYKSLNGIDNLNKLLQHIFNKEDVKKNELEFSDVTYRVGDKVLQLVNDPDNNVYNGDIGYISAIINSKKSASKRNEIWVDFDGNVVTYTPDKYINIRHGYAISVHKAQGSEFPMVIMPIVNSFNRMLYNKLIYTAVTRAKKVLMLVGDPRAFLNGVNNERVEIRKTTLKDKIINRYCNLEK